MPKIYTRTGDTGETALLGAGRVRKDDLRVEAYGTVDELNAALGIVRAELARGGTAPADLDRLLAQLQNRLFDLGAELATRQQGTGSSGTGRVSPSATSLRCVSDAHVAELEQAIDLHEAQLEPLRAFILPGGASAAAALHLARCIARRAERRIVRLAADEPVRAEALRFVNRLSDLLFVLARAVNQANRVADVTWPAAEDK